MPCGEKRPAGQVTTLACEKIEFVLPIPYISNVVQLAVNKFIRRNQEQLGGSYLVEDANREEAAATAAKIPGARFGSAEARPILTLS